MFIIKAVLILTGLVFSFFLLYYIFLAVAGTIPARKFTGRKEKKRFFIIIPAHNEEKVIRRTLESLRQIDYPHELFTLAVIADNCNDLTVSIAQGMKACCLIRNDTENPGKGQALQWAFPQILKMSSADAFVIIDADTIVETNFLETVNNRLLAGAEVIQTYYDVLEPESSPMASLTFLGFAISRNFKYKGRSRIGWSSNLLGNGMCMSRKIIEKYGWQALTISEDLEYQLQLLLNGIPVTFAAETRIYAEMPSGIKTYHKQRARWDVGKYKLRNTYAPILLARGLKERKAAFLDAFLELIIPPYMLFTGSAIFFSLVYMLLFGSEKDGFYYMWTALASGLVIYTIAGLIAAKAGLKVYFNLLYAPLFLFWRLFIAIGSVFNEGKNWVKTVRE